MRKAKNFSLRDREVLIKPDDMIDSKYFVGHYTVTKPSVYAISEAIDDKNCINFTGSEFVLNYSAKNSGLQTVHRYKFIPNEPKDIDGVSYAPDSWAVSLQQTLADQTKSFNKTYVEMGMPELVSVPKTVAELIKE